MFCYFLAPGRMKDLILFFGSLFLCVGEPGRPESRRFWCCGGRALKARGGKDESGSI